jgi:hypothetical protein
VRRLRASCPILRAGCRLVCHRGTIRGQKAILQLEAVPWASVCVGGSYPVGVRAEAGCYGAQVDVVELVRVLPGVFGVVGVVDFEAAVRQDEGRLNGREAGADYGGGGVLGCEFDGLDSGADGDDENVVDAPGRFSIGRGGGARRGLGGRGGVGGLICLVRAGSFELAKISRYLRPY